MRTDSRAGKIRSVKLAAIAAVLVAALSMLAAGAFAVDEKPEPVATAEAATEAGAGQVYYIKVESVISPAIANFIKESVKTANKDGVECLVIMLDTPGGLLEATRDIVQSFFSSRVPVVVYVAPGGARAGSAGVFITVASHVAAMAPGTNIGAAHPVSGGGQDMQGDMREKVVNDAVAQIKSWAQQRGRNVEWVERAVRESVSITDEEALKKNVVEYRAASLDDLLNKIDGLEVEVTGDKKITLNTKAAPPRQLKMSLRQVIVSKISEPNIAYILLLIGLLGLFLEYLHPGTFVPGIIGGICIILFFVVQSMPINYVGVALILLAIGLFITEIFITSFGLLTLGGLICFVVGAILLFDTKGSTVSVSWGVIIPTVVLMVVIFLGVGFLVMKTQFGKPVSGKEGLVGEVAVARTELNPEGRVFFHGELWTAHSKAPVQEGGKVRVLNVKNMRLEVEPAEEENGG